MLSAQPSQQRRIWSAFGTCWFAIEYEGDGFFGHSFLQFLLQFLTALFENCMKCVHLASGIDSLAVIYSI